MLIKILEKIKIFRNSIMSSVGSNGAGVGNTRTTPDNRISPSKRWCMTLNNYTDENIQWLVPLFQEYCKKYILAKEIGECGTPHLQGFFEFKIKRRPKSVFERVVPCPTKRGDNIRPHFEKARACDLDQVIYCSKEGSVIEKVGLPNIPRPLKVINPDRAFQQEILEIIKGSACDRKIFWYFGDGNIGKTQFCKYLSYKHDAICLSGKGADVRNGVVEYKKNHGDTPELVLFPIPRSYNTEYLSYEALENIKDMYFYSGKYEGGMINGNPPHLIVFANEPPDINKMSRDRWCIFHIDSKTYKTSKWSGY